MLDIQFFHKENLVEFDKENSKSPVPYYLFFREAIQNGTSAYLNNSNAEFAVVSINGKWIPLTFNEKNGNATYLTSLISQYFSYTANEIKRKNSKFFLNKFALLVGLFFGKRLFELFGSKDLVVINNFLLSSNPIFLITREEMACITKFLKAKFFSSILLFKGINNDQHKKQLSLLNSLGYLKIPSRVNYWYDNKEAKKKRPLQQDRKRWEKQQDFNWVIVNNKFKDSELEQILKYYQQVYLEKYSFLNPNYTKLFILNAQKSGLLRFELLRDSQRAVAVQAILETSLDVTTPFIGYDNELPQSLGLYRFLNLRLIEMAKTSHKALNMSSGAAIFKMQRGGLSQYEYHLIYVDHLNALKKYFWHYFSKYGTMRIFKILEQQEN